MKYLIFLVTILSTLWQWSVSYTTGWQAIPLTLMSLSWILGTIYSLDFIRAMQGRNSPYMCEFYGELKKDIQFALISALVLAFILYLSPSTYSLSNIDIAFAGFPFLLMSIWDIQSLSTRRVAGSRLPKAMTRLLLILLLTTIAIYIYYLVQIVSNSYPARESLWIQITLLLTAFCWCIFAHQTLFILKKQRMEISPVLVEIFDDFKISQGLYKKIEPMVKKWNEIVFKKKLQQQQDKHKKKKRANH